MNHYTDESGFTGVLPDGSETHDEDEFYDEWAEYQEGSPELEEDF